ncbi:hypothetical protein EYF80_008779 [Liparis tanakae]|uniref:Uncharacterized protein n=1 Tax=Liparis tanakae TaxID=230148 RepID=A0A4Z2IV85_9TELE|nr:hypothetical protein EYF80_008779 [Liparis tanakae]
MSEQQAATPTPDFVLDCSSQSASLLIGSQLLGSTDDLPLVSQQRHPEVLDVTGKESRGRAFSQSLTVDTAVRSVGVGLSSG